MNFSSNYPNQYNLLYQSSNQQQSGNQSSQHSQYPFYNPNSSGWMTNPSQYTQNSSNGMNISSNSPDYYSIHSSTRQPNLHQNSPITQIPYQSSQHISPQVIQPQQSLTNVTQQNFQPMSQPFLNPSLFFNSNNLFQVLQYHLRCSLAYLEKERYEKNQLKILLQNYQTQNQRLRQLVQELSKGQKIDLRSNKNQNKKQHMHTQTNFKQEKNHVQKHKDNKIYETEPSLNTRIERIQKNETQNLPKASSIPQESQKKQTLKGIHSSDEYEQENQGNVDLDNPVAKQYKKRLRGGSERVKKRYNIQSELVGQQSSNESQHHESKHDQVVKPEKVRKDYQYIQLQMVPKMKRLGKKAMQRLLQQKNDGKQREEIKKVDLKSMIRQQKRLLAQRKQRQLKEKQEGKEIKEDQQGNIKEDEDKQDKQDNVNNEQKDLNLLQNDKDKDNSGIQVERDQLDKVSIEQSAMGLTITLGQGILDEQKDIQQGQMILEQIELLNKDKQDEGKDEGKDEEKNNQNKDHNDKQQQKQSNEYQKDSLRCLTQFRRQYSKKQFFQSSVFTYRLKRIYKKSYQQAMKQMWHHSSKTYHRMINVPYINQEDNFLILNYFRRLEKKYKNIPTILTLNPIYDPSGILMQKIKLKGRQRERRSELKIRRNIRQKSDEHDDTISDGRIKTDEQLDSWFTGFDKNSQQKIEDNIEKYLT